MMIHDTKIPGALALLAALLLVGGCGDGKKGDRDADADGTEPDGDTGDWILPDSPDGQDGQDGQDGEDVADVPTEPDATYGAEFYVAPWGSDESPGTFDEPFATLERARQAVRDLKSSSGLPAEGVVVWLREGVYERGETFELTEEDSGEEGRPVAYRGYLAEWARLVGGTVLDPSWFSTVDESSPVWDRVDPAARGSLVMADLGSHGISDYGELFERGFGSSQIAAMELFFNGAPMTLARWPDADEDTPPPTPLDEELQIYGDPNPDVTGRYVHDGSSDSVNRFRRDGLVGGLQYYLYRNTWDYEGSTYTAWFLTTDASGYPSDAGPWWYRYSPDLGPMEGSNGATGMPTIIGPEAFTHGFVSIASALSDTAFTYHGDRPDRWVSAEAVWMHGFWKYWWADLHAPVESLDTGSKTVTFSDAPGYGIETGQLYYAENLLEEITQAGEWYLERSSGILYFWPPGDIASGESIVSMMTDPVVAVRGAHHVMIQDLTIEAGRGDLVVIEEGSDNSVAGCILRNAGRDAASVSGTRNGVQRCEIADPGDGGVNLTGGDRASLTPGENYLRNCHIQRYGRWSWTYQPAAYVSGAGQIVAHNSMHDAPHTAILFNGNEHLFEFNDIHDVCKFSSDAGAIYTGRDWGYRGNLIRWNFIHDVDTAFEGFGVHGVYMDDCVSGIEVFGNVIYRVSGNGIEHGGGRDDIMHNNVIARCGDAMVSDNRGVNWITNEPGDSWNLLERLTYDGIQYQADPWATAYPDLAVIPNDWAVISDPATYWRYPEGNVFSRTIGFDNGNWMTEQDWGGGPVFDLFREIADNIPDQDPLFVDEASLNLALRPESPAYTIPGFEPIPFDQIGIEP